MTGRPEPVPEPVRTGSGTGLRRYIAEHVIGGNPPPLTAEAQDLIRAMLGTSQAGESSAETA
jgi:hypothetical protein